MFSDTGVDELSQCITRLRGPTAAAAAAVAAAASL